MIRKRNKWWFALAMVNFAAAAVNVPVFVAEPNWRSAAIATVNAVFGVVNLALSRRDV